MPAVSVQVTDAFGNAVAAPGAVVTLTPDHGTLRAGTVATTDAAGLATFDQLTVSDAGTYRLSATSDTALATPAPTSDGCCRKARALAAPATTWTSTDVAAMRPPAADSVRLVVPALESP